MTQRGRTLSIVFLSLCFLGFVVLALPPTCNLIITFVEQLMGRELRDPDRWIEIIQHCSTIALCVIALVFFLGLTKKGNDFACLIKQESHPFLQFLCSRSFVIMSVGTFAFYFLCFYKLIDSDFYYADDLWRSFDGSRSWIGFSRYVSEFLSIVLHNNVYLPDIAPLTQFISLAVYSFSTILLAWLVTEGNITVGSLLICSLLFLSPFNAQNLSYRFDSPYMALAAFFPMVPFLFKKEKKSFVFISIISLILCCMSYQSGTSIYILLAIFLATSLWLKKESYQKIFTFVGLSVFSVALALVLFKLLFMNTINNGADSYSATVSLSVMPQNFKTYLLNTIPSFGGLWIKGFVAISILVALVLGIKVSRQNKLVTAIFLIVMGFLSLFLSFGPYLIFAKPLFSPRAFTGFSMLITLVCTSLYKNFFVSGGGKKALLIPAFCLVYGCIVFQFAYGVALAEQKQYQDFRVEHLLSDLSQHSIQDEKNYVSFSGSIGLSDGIAVNSDTFPLINHLISVVPSGGGIWNDDLLSSYNFNCEDEYLSENPGWPLLKSSYYHDIYGEGNHFFIVLKN